MNGEIPIVTFDTSALNRLAKGGPLSEAVLAGMKAGFLFRFAGLSIEELVACKDLSTRTALFAYCRRLQEGPSDCLCPHHELVRILITDHVAKSAAFDWKTVEVRAVEYEEQIREGFLGDDRLSNDQRKEQSERKKKYKKVFTDPRPRFEKVFADYGVALPTSFREAIAGKSLTTWKMGKWLYDPVAKSDVNEASIKEFIAACPPFRALIHALLMSYYNHSLRDRQIGEKLSAGRNDMLMSVCLPYCHKFVTNDGEQEKCLREVSAVADLGTEVVSYDAFCRSFLTEVAEIREMLDGRYDEIKSGRVKPINGEAFFDSLRQRENELHDVWREAMEENAPGVP